LKSSKGTGIRFYLGSSKFCWVYYWTNWAKVDSMNSGQTGHATHGVYFWFCTTPPLPWLPSIIFLQKSNIWSIRSFATCKTNLVRLTYVV